MTVADLLIRVGELLQVGALAAAELCALELLALEPLALEPHNLGGWCRLGEVFRQAGRLGDAMCRAARPWATSSATWRYRKLPSIGMVKPWPCGQTT